MDVIASHRCGLPIAVASCGTALTEQHIKLLKRYTQDLCFLFDNDDAGRQATIKGIKIAYQHELYPNIINLPSTYKDLDDVANDSSLS
jgi:DNA primase